MFHMVYKRTGKREERMFTGDTEMYDTKEHSSTLFNIESYNCQGRVPSLAITPDFQALSFDERSPLGVGKEQELNYYTLLTQYRKLKVNFVEKSFLLQLYLLIPSPEAPRVVYRALLTSIFCSNLSCAYICS